MTTADTTAAWLQEVGLSESNDPDVQVLLSAATELDWLDSNGNTLTGKDLVTARKSVHYTMTQARKNLQRTIDRNDSASTRRRHQVLFAGVLGPSLGWIDINILSPETKQLVIDELATTYGITVADMKGIVKEL